ncbi:aa3-type cytochrome c oxidase subunit IV [Aurantiacibacter aquimixticola]|nr:aa3-type cytochrome c oxidase subunit IV [Aurantiacibacter aquimixticola]
MKKAHGTYASFIGMLKWAVPLILAIAFFVVILIA